MEIENVKNVIRNAVKQYTGVYIESDDKNLLSTDYPTLLADFL